MNLTSRLARLEEEHGTAREALTAAQCMTRMQQGDDFSAYLEFCQCIREWPAQPNDKPKYDWVDDGRRNRGQRLAVEKGRALADWPFISLMSDEALAAGKCLLLAPIPWSCGQWAAWKAWCARAANP